MMKYVIVVLALIAVASAQLIYGGYTGANLHPGIASSAQTGIRRYGGYAPVVGYAAAPGLYY